MSRILLLLCLVVAVYAASEPRLCGWNERFSDCAVACEPTCSMQKPVCIGQCRKGCECKPGFVRHPNGECVLPRECNSDSVGSAPISKA